MKNAKKIVSLMLALAMVLSMSVVAFAVDTTGKITITNTVKGTRYNVYRILNLDSYDNANKSYVYKVNENWTGFFAAADPANSKEAGPGLAFVNIDAKNSTVTWKEGCSKADFAAAAIKYAKDNSMVPTRYADASGDNVDVVIPGLSLGYYLVQSSFGALCALTTTKPEATVEEKNVNPSLDKLVKEGTEWLNANDANVGDTVEFKATITVQGTAINYIMHDKMDSGLYFSGVTKVTLNGVDVNNAEEANYTVDGAYSGPDSAPTPAADGDSFDVKFKPEFCKGLNSGDEIVVYYTAILNKKAIKTTSETNSAKLQYEDKNGETHNTNNSETETYTWELPVFKYTGDSTTKTPLAGATFSLYKDEACTNIVKFKADDDNPNLYIVIPNGEKVKFTTDSTGLFKLDGLDSGTYYLKEIDSPKGYNKVDEPIKVEINNKGQINPKDADGNNTIDNGEYLTQIDVKNEKGAEMPTTGGIGTTIFYVLGSVLLIGAGVLLITKKRMNIAR